MKYEKFLLNNVAKMENKTAVIIGATGSLGNELCEYLLKLKANIIITTRNKQKGEDLIKELNKKYPAGNISCLELDLSSVSSTLEFIHKLIFMSVDYLVFSAGIYHLEKQMIDDKYERHYLVNYLNQMRIIESLCQKIKERRGKIIVVGSIAARFAKLDFNDIMSINCQNKTHIYARSKKLLMTHCAYLNRHGFPIYLVHPGISATSLFDESKGGFGKKFNKIIVPIMRKIFISPAKAALSIVYAFTNEVPYGYQVGPRGLFNIYGYPKVYKLHRNILDVSMQSRINTSYQINK